MDTGLELGGRVDRDGPAASVHLEFDHTVGSGEESVVAPAAHVASGMEVGASLAYDDAASTHVLAAVPLHTESVGIAISAVSARPHALLMCHQVLLGSVVPKTER